MNDLNATDINLIERRLDKQLSESEIQSFGERLNMDSEFKAAYISYQTALKAIHIAGEDDVMDILKEEQAKLDLKKTTQSVATSNNPQVLTQKRPSILRGWLVAAAIALICAVTYWFVNTKKSIDAESLFAENHVPKTNTFIKLTRDTELTEIQRKATVAKYGLENGTKIFNAIYAYENSKFEEAASIFGSIDVKNDTLSLYHANALLQLNQTQSAIAVLDKVSPNTPSVFEALWYKAMAYLKNNDIEKAKLILEQIADVENNGYQAKSKILLEKLR